MLPGGTHVQGWPSLLVVDQDLEMRQTLVCYFEQRGFHVAAGRNLAEAKTFFQRKQGWALVIADYHLPDGTGSELYGWVREQAQATPVILMSGSPHAAAICAGLDYLAKPFGLDVLEKRVRSLLGRR